jgi:hypothetical protein
MSCVFVVKSLMVGLKCLGTMYEHNIKPFNIDRLVELSWTSTAKHIGMLRS